MPFALLIVGLLLVVTGANDTYKQMGGLVIGDLTGSGNFLYWILAFGALGAIGYNETLRPFSRAFMVLIFVVLIVRNGGLFQKLSQGLNTGTAKTNITASNNVTQSAAKLAETASTLSTAFDTLAAVAV